MGNSLKRGWITVFWTTVLMSTLWAIDRTFLGPSSPIGWTRGSRIEDVPLEAGKVKVPSYFPPDWQWPPTEIYYKKNSRAGWWLGLHSTIPDLKDQRVWIGTEVDPKFEHISEFVGCFEFPSDRKCPSGWYTLSKQTQDQKTLYLLTNISKIEAIKILEGL